MSKQPFSLEEERIIAAIIRRGPVPAGAWEALAAVTGRSKASIRAKAAILRKEGPRPAYRKPAGRPPTKAAAAAAPTRAWWQPWRR